MTRESLFDDGSLLYLYSLCIASNGPNNIVYEFRVYWNYEVRNLFRDTAGCPSSLDGMILVCEQGEEQMT
jgi:hypothetical protein